jgi:hypothetical protein
MYVCIVVAFRRLQTDLALPQRMVQVEPAYCAWLSLNLFVGSLGIFDEFGVVELLCDSPGL